MLTHYPDVRFLILFSIGSPSGDSQQLERCTPLISLEELNARFAALIKQSSTTDDNNDVSDDNNELSDDNNELSDNELMVMCIW